MALSKLDYPSESVSSLTYEISSIISSSVMSWNVPLQFSHSILQPVSGSIRNYGAMAQTCGFSPDGLGERVSETLTADLTTISLMTFSVASSFAK